MVETLSKTKSGSRRADYEQQRLLQDYEWLRSLTHISPVAILRCDAKGACTFVNDRWCEMTGVSFEKARGSFWSELIHPDDVEPTKEAWCEAAEKRQPFRRELRYIHANTRVIWVLAQAKAELDGNGEVIGYVTAMTEVTELRQMREALQKSNAELEQRMGERAIELQRMALMVAASDDALVSLSLTGEIVTWNPGAERIFGYTEAEMIGQQTLVLTPPDRLDEARELKARARSGEEIHRFETVRLRRDGVPIDVAISLLPLRCRRGELMGTLVTVRDITEAKRSERDLRQLSWRLLRIQDEERRRLARELHDSTAQTLAALCMNLSAVARVDPVAAPERVKALLADSLELAELATRELRSTSYLLHPPLLEERGLPAALRWFVSGFSDRSRIDVKLELPEELLRLPEEMEVTLFRVVQESLLNIFRHSQSREALVRLHREAGQITLEVRDKGCGIAPSHHQDFGVGISGMKERLLQLGGELRIEPNMPGTAVIARIPHSHDSNSPHDSPRR